MAVMRELGVWWDGKHVGTLTQDRSGDLGFQYDPAWDCARDAARGVTRVGLDDGALARLAEDVVRRAERVALKLPKTRGGNWS